MAIEDLHEVFRAYGEMNKIMGARVTDEYQLSNEFTEKLHALATATDNLALLELLHDFLQKQQVINVKYRESMELLIHMLT